MLGQLKRFCRFGALALVAGALLPSTAFSEEPQWRHGTALIGDVKYPEGFAHFDYVNPQAPKGGRVRMSATGTFDNMNYVIRRGTPPVGIGLIYDTLTTFSQDEVSVEYGLLAESLQYPEDFGWVKFRLRDGIKWHDGTPITPEDVVWSFEQWVKHNPQYTYYYRNVSKAEVSGEREVTFTFDQTGNRELPQIIGQLTVLPKHWWTGIDAKGNPRDIASGTLEPPLGSGPYKVGTVDNGRSIAYERVDDYWGKNLNVNVGRNNFDEIRFEYYRDEVVELEAFKADQFDWRYEATAKNWVTAYKVPAVENGNIVLEKFPQDSRGRGLMVAFIPNTRREKLADVRVRKALNYALNFQEMNHTIFFDLYDRIDSYFFGTDLASRGLPEGLELEILESVRSEVPESVFTTPYTNPVSGDARQERNNLRTALQLLKEAGYEQKGRQLVNAETGEPFTLEFLMNGNRFERVGLRYQESLKKIGIDLQLRIVDSSQYINRVRSRDFDLLYTGWAQSLSPGNEQRNYWGSAAASVEASQNYAGINDPAIDKLINRIILSKDREELVASTRALDRVLLSHHFVVPGWTSIYTRVAHWDRFSHPEELPTYDIGFPDVWWYDEAKAAAVEARK
ncbi:ABC transporter substrate-binding protein [Rhodobacteraceae bacterium RKSG542]|uniref:extracellular solute-binding protein n=1 Tax=Pseudovibrio flavus TaxID=2529854 RepID=UPI0012BC5D8B|nr:extracellular solute-binding protein [Pseudovibrio flavus]MTI17880.1 ABC transporter substrate-binding protein [Pseudovibrio flavus]